MELEQAINNAVEVVWFAGTQASTAPCNKHVCVTANSVFVRFLPVLASLAGVYELLSPQSQQVATVHSSKNNG